MPAMPLPAMPLSAMPVSADPVPADPVVADPVAAKPVSAMPVTEAAVGVEAAMDGAERGLATLAGLAPSAVLRGRLRRHAALLPALPATPSEDDPAWAALLDAVTVQETRLFRAPAQMAALGDLLAADAAPEPLPILSAGCATGEEAWTLAAIAAAAGRRAAVTGLDLCRPALRVAAAGLYGPGPPDPLRDVPEPHRAVFETRDGRVGLRPRPGVSVAFRRANLLALPDDLPRFGVILCRNVLIYLLPAAREAALGSLLRRLRPGGLLVLGPTDGAPDGAGLHPLDRTRAIWRRA